MTWADEGKNHNSEPKELLPTGDKARGIIEVLAAMYRAIHNPHNVAHNDSKVEGESHQKDTEHKGEG